MAANEFAEVALFVAKRMLDGDDSDDDDDDYSSGTGTSGSSVPGGTGANPGTGVQVFPT